MKNEMLIFQLGTELLAKLSEIGSRGVAAGGLSNLEHMTPLLGEAETEVRSAIRAAFEAGRRSVIGVA